MPKITVLLPSLNVKKYIRETLLSVTNQTLKDIEILCIDAGSTDGTLEILKEFEQADERVRVLLSEKKSYGYQLNLGVREAKGDYIGIVETDDFIEKDMYECLYHTAQQFDADVVKSDFDMFVTLDNGEYVSVTYPLKTYHRVEYNTLYSKEAYISGTASVECYIWNAVYRKSFLQQKDILFNESPGASFQDFGFKYQVGFSADRIVAVNKSFYRYRRDNSGSSTYNSRSVEFNLRESKYLLSVLDKWGADKRVYAAAARGILQYAVWPYMDICKWGKPAENTIEMIREYKVLFEEFLQKHYIEESLVPADLWETFNLLLEGVDLFDGYIKVISRLGRNKAENVVKLIKNKNQVVIYGCGQRGIGASIFLMNNRCINLISFCDRNDAKQGDMVNGLEVVSPELATQRYPNATFLIAAGAQLEIKQYLNTLHVEDDRILFYNLQWDPFFCTNRL